MKDTEKEITSGQQRAQARALPGGLGETGPSARGETGTTPGEEAAQRKAKVDRPSGGVRRDDVPAVRDARYEEQTFIEAATEGDRKAQGVLVRRYERRVYGLILRFVGNHEDARDILQDTMVKALTSLNLYDAAYPFVTWLYRIATHKSLDFLRKRKVEMRRLVFEDKVDPESLAETASPIDEQIAAKLDWDIVEGCMDNLDPRYRAVLLLRYKDGLSYKEIAGALGIPMGTVKVILHRGRLELKRLVRKEVGGI
jgi:RNA polymerase sigma-70 factor (ECF subfamily)